MDIERFVPSSEVTARKLVFPLTSRFLHKKRTHFPKQRNFIVAEPK